LQSILEHLQVQTSLGPISIIYGYIKDFTLSSVGGEGRVRGQSAFEATPHPNPLPLYIKGNLNIVENGLTGV
jgi:hypothetical protein